MAAFALLRALVFLRRIWTELKISNEIAESRLNLERDRLGLEFPKWDRKIGQVQHIQIDRLDMDFLDNRWKEAHRGEEEEKRP